jgi:hypothetical protein
MRQDGRVRTVHIGKLCSHKGCRRRGVVAQKLSNFWVVYCEDHKGGPVTLDMTKICDEGGK